MKYIIIIILALITISCNVNNSTEVEKLKSICEKLKTENRTLKTENKQLEISLNQIEKHDIQYRSLVGIVDGKVEVGKNNRIVFLLHSFKEFPKYDIYRIEGNKEIKIGSNNLTSFDYQFNPKSIKETNLKLKVKIPYEGKIFEIPGEMNIPIE